MNPKVHLVRKYKEIEKRSIRLFKNKFTIKDEDVIYDAITSIFLQYCKNKVKVNNFNKWLNGAIFNHYYLYLNKKNRNRVFYFDEFINSPTYEDYPDLKIDIELMKKEILKLNSPYKEIITYRLIEDLSYKEISDKLKMKEGTIRNYYSRTIQKISSLIVTMLIYLEI